MSVVLSPPEPDVATDLGTDDDTVAPTTAPARVSAWVAVIALIAAVVLAPPTFDALAGGEFARVVSGVVEVRDGRAWDVVPVGEPVPQGATFRSVDEPAELDVRGGRLSLARWTELSADEQHVDLTRGEVLFEADRSYDVAFGALLASGRGTWRVGTNAPARYAVYDGGLALHQPGVDDATPVGRLREVTVTEGVADDVRPLSYLPTDPWDARLLAEAIRVDRLLAATERGLTVRYGTTLQTAEFYADFARFSGLLDHLPRLAVVAEDDRYGPPAETLVALVVAELLVAEAALEPSEAARRIDELRAAGAEWGLIVVEHHLTADDLDRTIERAVRQRGEAVAEGTAAPVLTPPPPPVEPSPPAPADPPTTPPPGEGDPTPPPSPPDDDPDPPDEPRRLEPVTDTVDDLGSLLEEVVPGASEVTDTVNDVVEDVEDLLPDVLP